MNQNTAQPLASLSRLSLNQITVNRWSLRETVEGCLRHKIPAIGLWRDKIAEIGLATSKKLIQDSGLKVSSLCRGGFFTAATRSERRQRIEDNLQAVTQAAELNAEVLVLVCGGIAGGDLQASRDMVADGIAEIAPVAKKNGVRLGIEPLHPMFAADRSVIATLREANDLAEKFDADIVGVIVDVFHVWWDAEVYRQIKRAGRRVLGFHISDWRVPLPDILLSRAMMGDGVIELRKLRAAVESAGYLGLIEVEIFNRQVWDAEPDAVLKQICLRYLRCA